MKNINIFFYILRRSLKNIAKNKFMVFASAAVIFAALFLLGTLMSVSENLQNAIQHYNDRAQVQINYAYYLTDEEAEAITEVIRSDERVETLTVISKEENLEKILSYYDDNRELFESYKDSELLQYMSLEVELKPYTDGDAFVSEVKQIDGVESVKDIVSTVNKLEKLLFFIRIGTVATILIVAALALLLIFNTVKLTVFARRSEIEIMKYVGATDAYITSPFLIEGMVTGFIGSILSFVILKIVYNAVYNAVADKWQAVAEYILTFKNAGETNFFWVFVALGVICGLVASYMAVKRYADV